MEVICSNRKISRPALIACGIALTAVILVGFSNFLLFHSLAEMFSVAVAGAIFMVAWNSRQYLQNGTLLLIGIAFLFIGGMDLLHTLAYKGMGVFGGFGADLSVRLWIVARYLQALTLLVAPFAVDRRIKPWHVFGCYAIVVSLAIASVFHLDLFPVCYVEGSGLTSFKIISEYVISAMMLASAVFLYRIRNRFYRYVFRLMIMFIATSIASEVMFTMYVSVYEYSVMAGHLLKVISFGLLYLAIVETGISEPYALVFRELEQSKDALRKARDELEIRVRERTSELAASNDLLHKEIGRREQAEVRIQRSLALEAALRKIDARILRGAGFQEALDTACDALLDLGYGMCWVGLAEPDFTIRPVSFRGVAGNVFGGLELRWDETPAGNVPAGIAVRTGRTYVCADILASSLYPPWREAAQRAGYRSSITVPLQHGGGVIGCIVVARDHAGDFSEDDVRIVETFAQQCTIALVSAKRIEELRATSQRLALHVQRMPLGYIEHDADLRITAWNPAAERILGWTANEAIGKHPFDLFVPPQMQERVRTSCAKLRAGDESWSDTVGTTVRKDGKPVTCEWFITVLRDTAGAAIGFHTLLHDISEKAALERQVQAAQRYESVGMLAGGIAHDFNNALTGIVGFSELLRVKLAGDEEALHDLNEILRCAERASTLTRQLLTYARRQVIAPVSLSLNNVVSDLTNLITKGAGERIEVSTVLAGDLPAIRADRGQIEQVLMNLFLNARDAMPGGGTLRIETRNVYLDEDYVRHNPYMRTGRYALLIVSDTGVGMDEKTRERAFEPFFTTKGPEKGTGLGLAMVFGIVKQHKGFIHLYSEPGMGTSFKVYFPAVEGPPDAVRTRNSDESMRGGKETLLLAEDEDVIRSLAERTLRDLGYRVLVARNGEEAVAIVRENDDIALAILDVVMPKMGGREALEEIRRTRPGLKALFVSGYAGNSIDGLLVSGNGTAFLEKPFGPTLLARRVREMLDTPG